LLRLKNKQVLIEEDVMGTIKAAVWSLLSGGFVYLYMTNHFIKANWVALIWIVMFAWQMTVSATKKGTTDRR
jgi:hypothetical protein